ncbi:hypothetical protein NZK32_05945 [Cyanobium sp. FGCU-52]|nr:hypothetical protein [Cyanobium sp. FGCU52]
MNSSFADRKRGSSEQSKATGEKILKYAPLTLLVASILISAGFILMDTGVVPGFPMDQHFVETVNLAPRYLSGKWAFQYPSLQNSGGITSSLIAGIYKIVVPTNLENLNWHIRIFAMATFLISTFMLIRTYISDRAVEILAFLIIASSGFQLLQPSSDLFAGTLLSLFFISVARSGHAC